MSIRDKIAQIHVAERHSLEDELEEIIDRLEELYESGEGDDEVVKLEKRRAEIERTLRRGK